MGVGLGGLKIVHDLYAVGGAAVPLLDSVFPGTAVEGGAFPLPPASPLPLIPIPQPLPLLPGPPGPYLTPRLPQPPNP